MKALAGIPELDFVKDDARNIASYGRFDAVVCSGLLYHLDRPRAFLKEIGKVTEKLLILNTHFAPANPGPLRSFGRFVVKRKPELLARKLGAALDQLTKASLKHPIDRYHLSAIQRSEGLPGRWYREHAPEASAEEKEKAPFASMDNPRSFWLMKSGLFKALRENGFSRIEERPDEANGIPAGRMRKDFCRGTFVAARF